MLNLLKHRANIVDLLIGKVHASMGFGPVRWALGNKYMAPFCCQVLAKRGGGNRRLRRSG